MKTRTSLLALAATAALALSALTPTNASAWGRFGGWHGYHHGFHGYRHGFYGYHHAFWGRYHWWPYRWYPRWRWYPRPIIYGAVGAGAAYAVAAPAVAPAAPAAQPTGSCLTKNYLPNGSVMFADMCTQEQAVAPTNGPPAQPGAQ